jgi:sugar phosphate isomerase/epimerase
MNRRQLLSLAGGAALASTLRAAGRKFGPVITFGKHLQWLSYDEVAAFLADNDFGGIEATVRKGGQVEPENVERDLPLLIEALAKRGQKVVMITTDIRDADDPLSKRVIKTADALGVRQFRMAYYRYDLDQPILDQLEAHRKTVLQLSDYLKDFQIMGLYQNHAGTNYVGSGIWDLHRLLEGVPAQQVSAVFDLRHATVEGGASWPVLWRLIRDRVRVVYLKDFRWEGQRIVNVPLGTGQVDPSFIEMVSTEVAEGTPISLHMEYISHSDASKQADGMKAIAHDRTTLRKLTGV